MEIVIDCEYNEHKGQLISMALVPFDGPVFYEVLNCENPAPWVAENVMPYLNKETVTPKVFEQKLYDYLNQFDSIELICDWLEDPALFCMALITGPGIRLDTPPLTIKVLRTLDLPEGDGNSEVLHNALSDATAIGNLYWGNGEKDAYGVSERLMWRVTNDESTPCAQFHHPRTGTIEMYWPPRELGTDRAVLEVHRQDLRRHNADGTNTAYYSTHALTTLQHRMKKHYHNYQYPQGNPAQ